MPHVPVRKPRQADYRLPYASPSHAQPSTLLHARVAFLPSPPTIATLAPSYSSNASALPTQTITYAGLARTPSSKTSFAPPLGRFPPVSSPIASAAPAAGRANAMCARTRPPVPSPLAVPTTFSANDAHTAVGGASAVELVELGARE